MIKLKFPKMLNGYENIDINVYLSLTNDNRTRGHEVTLLNGSV